AMIDAWGPAGVTMLGIRYAVFALLVVAHDQIAREHVDFLPVFVDERFRGEHARADAQQARARALLIHFVQMPGQNLMLDSRGVTLRRVPAFVQVEPMEFLVL